MIDGIGGRTPLNPLRASPKAPAPALVSAAALHEVRAPSSATAITRDLAASPPVDAAKVDRIKGAIAAGAYPIEPMKIAAAMIATDLKHG